MQNITRPSTKTQVIANAWRDYRAINKLRAHLRRRKAKTGERWVVLAGALAGIVLATAVAWA